MTTKLYIDDTVLFDRTEAHDKRHLSGARGAILSIRTALPAFVPRLSRGLIDRD